MKRALCIWLPEWPIQRLVADRPELRSQPIALHVRDPRRGRIIVACCAQARHLGVVPNMPLAEATTLTKQRSCDHRPAPRSASHRSHPNHQFPTDLNASASSHAHPVSGAPAHPIRKTGSHPSALAPTFFAEHEPDKDQKALADLAIWCEQFSPIVGLEQTRHPACLLLDLTGLAPIFGGEPRIVDLIHKAFAQRQYNIRLGIGHTVGEAWAIAHYGQSNTSLQPGQDITALPVDALRIPDNLLDTLQQLGLFTIADLLQLPRQSVATRLGEQLIQRLDQLLGKQSEVIVAYRPAPDFVAEWQLEHPTRRRDAVETILESLAVQLAEILAQQDHAVVQAEAILQSPKTNRHLNISLFQPSNQAKHLFDLLKLQSETVQFPAPIHCIRLVATATVRLHGGQKLLWDDMDSYHGQNGQREIGALVDRLSSRLGKESVFGVCAQSGALPEKAYRPKPLTSAMRERKTTTAATLKAPHRPLWLHHPPQRLQSITTHPTANRNQPPACFEFENQTHHIARHWGPERIETGWWRGTTVRRDYYRVETTAGCRFWLFRRVGDGGWFLHGCFE